MFSSKATTLVLVVAAMVLVATPIAIAAKNSNSVTTKDSHPDDENLVTVRGNVTAFLYDDDWENDAGDDDLDEMNEKSKTHEPRICAFVLDNETIVTFGPWWYWLVQDVNVTDVVRVGDVVNVTGELEEEDGVTVLCAWYIGNETTGNELTIREEGRPPWAGGPKALGIDPWPPSKLDD